MNTIYITHRHPAFWDNPEGFDPERFAPGNPESRPRFAHWPFGGGPHLCIGAGFAMMEAQLVLATVLQRYRLDLVPGRLPQPQPRVTLRQKDGVWVSLHPA
jgi:cytochrome P450